MSNVTFPATARPSSAIPFLYRRTILLMLVISAGLSAGATFNARPLEELVSFSF
jgi:hypothetical protein